MKSLSAFCLGTLLSFFVGSTIAVQSTITEAEGTSCMGDDQSRKETERTALADARRNASEYVSSLVQSSTKVEDAVLKEDLVTAFSRSRVEVVKVLVSEWFEEPGAGDCYRVRIQAEVIADEAAMEKLDQQQTMVDDPRMPLQARIWTDQDAYAEGDKVKIFLRGNKPFYAQVVYRDADGNLVQLLPNPYREANYFEGGVTYQLPSGEDRYELEVSPPFGKESIVLYASTEPAGEEVEVEEAGPYYVVTTEESDVSRSFRGVKLKAKNSDDSGAQGAAEFAETQVEINVAR